MVAFPILANHTDLSGYPIDIIEIDATTSLDRNPNRANARIIA